MTMLADHNDTTRAFRLLGGKKAMNKEVRTALEAHDLIMEGLSSKALLHLVEEVAALTSGDALSKAIGMSLRTLQRKRKTDAANARLSPEQSSRAWRFAEILGQATEILGGQAAAEDWMLTPAMALGNRRPIDLLASSAGAEAVEDHLMRMEYGVYS